MTHKTEADVQNSIRMALVPHAILFRVNTGTVKTIDGRFFSSGTPPGYSDLSGVRKSDGRAVFIEVKNAKGRPSKEQLHFIKRMKEAGAIAGIARSAEDAIKLIEEE